MTIKVTFKIGRLNASMRTFEEWPLYGVPRAGDRLIVESNKLLVKSVEWDFDHKYVTIGCEKVEAWID